MMVSFFFFNKADKPIIISDNIFEGVEKSSCILKVPIGSKNRYAKSPVWCDFETIIEI